MSLVVYFGEEACRDPAIVGGKGANLALLTQTELPVPEGFCVTTEAYSAFPAVNLTAVGELLGKLEQDVESLETLSAEPPVYRDGGPARYDVDGICSAYQRFGRRLRGRSFIRHGQHLAGARSPGCTTHLDIRGADAVVAASCWAPRGRPGPSPIAAARFRSSRS